MLRYSLSETLFIRRPVHQVFKFFSRPENLALITPPNLGFTIRTPDPIEMSVGLQIQYSIRLAGLRTGWTSVITEFDAPHRFVDEQLRGPYRLWRHRHTFEAVEGGTLVRDEVEYALPLGWLGRLAHPVFVRSQLRKIFAYRRAVVDHFFAIPFSRKNDDRVHANVDSIHEVQI